ncbi:hypothetical protein SBOR_5781 [Sclerotinia borealis F-4128]|uniref:Zn(2)-C6 fungal-type domain-containing protein n=1 Tax=Sclerotinia borealis (strain F-4128) TaxID=1432307 RepID=W9CH58_SCLBF|nr:hypothetical protein SBOR_5781 [Sclerotinia borealis F-4128]
MDAPQLGHIINVSGRLSLPRLSVNRSLVNIGNTPVGPNVGRIGKLIGGPMVGAVSACGEEPPTREGGLQESYQATNKLMIQYQSIAKVHINGKPDVLFSADVFNNNNNNNNSTDTTAKGQALSSRRVKCDEAKPDCMRCVRFGHKCEGYAYLLKFGAKPSVVTNIAPRALIPRIGYLPISPSTSPTSVASTTSSVLSQPEILASPPSLWRDQTAETCFRNFVREIAGSSSDFEVWWGLIFSGCQSSSLIFDAVHMIGSLDLRPKIRGNQIGTFRHMSAYHEYCNTKCLTKKRAVPYSEGPGIGTGIIEIDVDSRTTLIAHLLSNMMGRGNEVISHERVSTMYLGLRALRDWVTRIYIPQAAYLESMTETGCLKCFSKVELRILRYVDTQIEHERRTSLGEPDIEMMPGLISNLTEAKKDLEKVMMKSMDWLASTLKRHDFSAHNNDQKDHHQNNGLFFDIDPKLEEEKRMLREYERWNRSFSPLFEDHQKRCQSNDKFHCDKDSDLLLAYTLRMSWLSGYILIASSNHLDRLDISEGRFSAQVQELRDIAKVLRSTPSWRAALEESGNFELATIIPSMVVGWETRDRNLRRISVAMLLRGMKYDCSSTGGARSFMGAVGRVMERLVEIEEDDNETNSMLEGTRASITEKDRCKNIEMGFDAAAMVAFMRCSKADPTIQGLAGSERRREIVIQC